MFFKTVEEAEVFANQYNVPLVDVLLMGLNLMGTSGESISTRGRFRLVPDIHDWPFFFALTIDQQSPFHHNGTELWLNNQLIGSATPIHPDTCSETYIRNGGRAMTLNSNSRSSCRGCKFCGTFSLIPEEFSNLLEEDNLRRAAEGFLREGLVTSYQEMESIGLVTGCFRTDELCLEHLLMIQKVFGELGFTGEIRYIGSQIRTKDAVDRLAGAGRFSLYSTVECFERRDKLMKRRKSGVSLDQHVDILGYGKQRGLETSMLYILGLDGIDSITTNFNWFKDSLTRHPLINLMQVYTPGQERLRHPEAADLNYYLKSRLAIEKIFSGQMMPLGYDNYRSPWYSEYAGMKINNPI